MTIFISSSIIQPPNRIVWCLNAIRNPCYVIKLLIKNRPSVAGDDPNKQTRNQTSRGVSQQVRDYFTGRQNKKTTENQR